MRGLIRYTRPNNLFDWDGLMDNFFTDTPVWNARVPAIDVREEEDEYLMEVELPGLTDKDIELNVEDNIITLSSKKEETKEIPIIFVTAKTEVKDWTHAIFNVGVNSYITKPINPKKLLDKVKSVLKMKQSRDELRKTREKLSKTIGDSK